MITDKEIKAIILGELDENSPIKKAREMTERLKMHIDGVGFDKYLEQVNDYQTEEQREARVKLATSNKHIVSELRRPYDNVFAAKGGSRHYEFKTSSAEESFIADVLLDVKDGYSLSEYAEKVWFENYFRDPNGLVFIEVEAAKNSKEAPKAYVTAKSINSIKGYKQNGNGLDWVIFEAHEKNIVRNDDNTEHEEELFWVVDSESYRLFKKSKDKVEELTNKRVENTFKEVPARLNSDIIDNVTGWKKSPIDDEIELLNKYLISSSVLNIAEFIHNYPRMWMYFSKCTACDGKGTTRNGSSMSKCSVCGGKGRMIPKDVVDVIEMKLPDAGEPSITAPAGYIQMGTAGWEMMFKSVDRTRAALTYSHWGTTTEKGENETATARFIDVQPVHNRLNKSSAAAERMEAWIATMLGKHYHPNSFEKAEIRRGRNYLIETAKQIWENYLTSKKDKAPISVLDLLMNQYLESEFKEDGSAYAYELKKFLLEPFPHNELSTIVTNTFIRDVDKVKKTYFSHFIKTKTKDEILKTNMDELEKQLEIYIQPYLDDIIKKQREQENNTLTNTIKK